MRKTIKTIIKHFFTNEKTAKQKANLIRTVINLKTTKINISNYPIRLTIDPCNICHLKCILCPTGAKASGKKFGKLNLDSYQKILDECGDYLWFIKFYNWGEPLLNKDLFKMIRLARDRKIEVSVSTTLNFFNDSICGDIFNSGLTDLIISLSGISNKSVQKQQVGSDYEHVMKNFKQLVEMKTKRKSKLPFIQWRFLVNKYNEQEIERAKLLSRQLKVNKFELCRLRCDMGKELLLSNEQQFENVKSWLPENEQLSMYNYSKKQKKKIKKFCAIPWTESVIQPDGSVSSCDAVWDGKYDLGNITNSSFFEIWNNEQYQNARLINRGSNSVHNHICSICTKNKAII